jgi:hypothetical protein
MVLPKLILVIEVKLLCDWEEQGTCHPGILSSKVTESDRLGGKSPELQT